MAANPRGAGTRIKPGTGRKRYSMKNISSKQSAPSPLGRPRPTGSLSAPKTQGPAANQDSPFIRPSKGTQSDSAALTKILANQLRVTPSTTQMPAQQQQTQLSQFAILAATLGGGKAGNLKAILKGADPKGGQGPVANRAKVRGAGFHASPEQAKRMFAQMLRNRGLKGQIGAGNWLGMQESGFRWNADNPTSSAYGIPQRMGSVHGHGSKFWRNNVRPQLRWFIDYTLGRYGSFRAAKRFHQQHNWY